MPQIKISFEDFIARLDKEALPTAIELHEYLLDNGCKATYEEKANGGLIGSYKHTKTKKVICNQLLNKKGFVIRIYGENINKYNGFLQDMPQDLVDSIEKATPCRRLVSGGCSPKCRGYDFMIKDKHFQKCRYSCFELFVTQANNQYIKEFVEKELTAREENI